MVSDIYILPMTVRGEVKSRFYPTLEEAIEEIGDCSPILKEVAMPNMLKQAVSGSAAEYVLRCSTTGTDVYDAVLLLESANHLLLFPLEVKYAIRTT